MALELVIRGAVIYVVLFFLMRASGSRQFSEMTAFDAVLIILIAEVTGQALVGEDYSLVAAIVVLATIIGIDLAASLVKERNKKFAKLVDGQPVLIFEHGKVIEEVMRKERVRKEDILEAARETQGLESLDQVKYAVLEAGGQISIVPREKSS